jgi:hypothetical protein
MTQAYRIRRWFAYALPLLVTTLLLTTLCLVASLWLMASVCSGQPAQAERREWKEPVYRVTKASPPEAAQAADAPKSHPLDPALEMAGAALKRMRTEIRDYTCTMVKRERVNGKLLDHEYMFVKIRNRHDNRRTKAPFSVYMKFLKPKSVEGREVIYVEGRNSGKMVAHEGGMKGKMLPTVWIKPTGALAMRNNRYPITEIGIENLTAKLIEKGERDRRLNEKCDVKFFKGAKINGRSCTCLQVTHPERRPYHDFHLARIFIDDEMNLPVRYEAYDWPAAAGGQPVLLEEYTYLNLKLNPRLSDADFDHRNPNYRF